MAAFPRPGLSDDSALWQNKFAKEEIALVNAVPAVRVMNLHRHYGTRAALAGVSFTVFRGELFALLGPNGGGKTTLFKILSTLLSPTSGDVEVFGYSLSQHPHAVRSCLGVVFQHPSLDAKLTVLENLQHHGHLYGLRGKALRERSLVMLKQLGIAERANDLVETLSGGMQRRVELAKGLLHKPDLLLLDEPSTGLDPGARRDFTNYLLHLRDQEGVTIILTTHIMEEAERCDRVGILHQGKLVALDTPDALKARVGGDVVAIRATNLQEFREKLVTRFGCAPVLVDGSLRIERPRGHEFVREVVEAFPGEVQSVTFGRPTLEDVFIHQTGHHFWNENGSEERVA
ncbi:MAG TPA: ATP-binding cassette domain-containing protein [Methylomirabilota bacterium]|nr:ATP-binding cassette domain-containing protein [Methylomirabilota bacterium]